MIERTQDTQPALAVFCDSLVIGEEPLTSDYFWGAYQDFMLAVKGHGVDPYLVGDRGTYEGVGSFATAFVMGGHKVASPQLLREVTDVQVELVMERSGKLGAERFPYDDVVVVNNRATHDIVEDKIATYERFADLQPDSVAAQNYEELEAAVATLPGDRIVVKPPLGYGGNGILIGSKDRVLAQAEGITFPVLAQEFLDTSCGVPGEAAGVHDLRINVCGGMAVGQAIRLAGPGSYVANVSQGGSAIHLPLSSLAPEIREKIEIIDARLPQVPRSYSADFFYSDRGLKLGELNDYVGLIATDNPEAFATINRIAGYHASVAKHNFYNR
jgi:glutathione synthase/RimK-type ligase-like ATP-grasp enzyme